MASLRQAPLSTFTQVRDQVFSDPYPRPLPVHLITLASFYSGVKNLLLKATRRALDDPSDLAPHFQKLVHPNGVALAGTWNITEKSPYTGYFSEGSKGLVIVRCSVLLYKTMRGQPRAFAFAGKIFPTLDPNEPVQTVDFQTIDVLAGTMAERFTGVTLTNAPPLGFNRDVIKLFGVVISTFGTFIRADFNPVFRPIDPVAECGVPAGAPVRSPRWMMVQAWPGSGVSDLPDFRDELSVENYTNHTLRFDIGAASGRLPFSRQRDWRHLGHIDLTESVVSDSCDHRLVFQHPRLQRKTRRTQEATRMKA